ncbi:MAG: hypothetical protein J6X93_00245 [Bacilli bacterium]|nr:hypothetical protein [Bacilli bacterium]
MSNVNDSLMNIAKEVVEKSDKPLAISEIAEKVFKIKGKQPTSEEIVKFGIDFMLCGDFICCGNKSKENVWDLKYRQSVAVLDKDVIEDLLEDDEDVKNNTLTDENIYDEDIDKSLDSINDDDDDEVEEKDDIEEELGLTEDTGEDNIEMVATLEEDDEDEEEDIDSDDLEDIVEGTLKDKE